MSHRTSESTVDQLAEKTIVYAEAVCGDLMAGRVEWKLEL